MNDQNASPAAPETAQPQKTKRSPRERLIVWGAIAILLVVTLIQARAWLGYRTTLANLRSIVSNHEDSPHAPPLTLSIAENVARGGLFRSTPASTAKTGMRSSTVTYRWKGLFRSYSMDLIVESNEENPGVLEIVPEGAPDEVQPLPPSNRWTRAVGVDTAIIQGLLGYPATRDELGITPDQEEQLDTIAMEALVEIDTHLKGKPAEEQFEIWVTLEEQSRLRFHEKVQTVLDEEQFSRYLGLTLQARGAATIAWPEIATDLKLTDEQRATHDTLLREREDGMKTLTNSSDRMRHLHLYEERLLAVLTPEQLEAWIAILGPRGESVKPWID